MATIYFGHDFVEAFIDLTGGAISAADVMALKSLEDVRKLLEGKRDEGGSPLSKLDIMSLTAVFGEPEGIPDMAFNAALITRPARGASPGRFLS